MINRPRKLLLEQLQHCHCALQCGLKMGRCLLQIPSLLSAQGAAQLSPLMPETPPPGCREGGITPRGCLGIQWSLRGHQGTSSGYGAHGWGDPGERADPTCRKDG